MSNDSSSDSSQIRPATVGDTPTVHEGPDVPFGTSSNWQHAQIEPELPEQIGVYRILSRIGEGGIGIVYKAEQREPVKRVVALKIIKLGMDTREVVQRFAAERQALAMMDHPNVARVFDAGSTPTGRPYFVMELVAGEPITDYCDRHNLSVRQRLELFLQVCAAVQHAHQKGIIHRDLKPTNILVAVKDSAALAKVIDFGIAKAISSRLTDNTLYTEQGQLIGTPEYMSPEQAEMNATDIDTRSDIYSLGVMLYEILAGAPPLDSKTLRRQAYSEIQRMIREVDPAPPSILLSRLNKEDAGRIAERRRITLPALAMELKRELEWIPLKAMRKDRTDRYQTAKEMAQDVQNYLGGLPLIAGPVSSMYRAKKFVRRNKLIVGAAAAFFAMLLAVTIVSVMLLQTRSAIVSARKEVDTSKEVSERALQEKALADQARAEAEQKAADAERAKDAAIGALGNMNRELEKFGNLTSEQKSRIFTSALLGMKDPALIPVLIKEMTGRDMPAASPRNDRPPASRPRPVPAR